MARKGLFGVNTYRGGTKKKRPGRHKKKLNKHEKRQRKKRKKGWQVSSNILYIGYERKEKENAKKEN